MSYTTSSCTLRPGVPNTALLRTRDSLRLLHQRIQAANEQSSRELEVEKGRDRITFLDLMGPKSAIATANGRPVHSIADQAPSTLSNYDNSILSPHYALS